MKPSQLNFSFPKETTVMEIPDGKKLRWNTSFIESRSILNETGISCFSTTLGRFRVLYENMDLNTYSLPTGLRR